MSSGKVVVDAEPVIKWLDEGDAWMRRGRALFVTGYSSTPAPVATGGTDAPADGGTAWRDAPASEKQLAFLEKNHIPIRAAVTKGEASDLIDGILRKLKERKQ